MLSTLYGGGTGGVGAGSTWTIDSSGNAALAGTLAVTGNYESWGRFVIYGASYAASATSPLTWTTHFMSPSITRTNNSSSFIVAQSGVYKFDCQVTFATGQAFLFVLNLQRSTNSGSTWTTQNGTYSPNASGTVINCFTLSSLVQATAGDWFQYTMQHFETSAVSINASYTFQTVCRVG